ncbi:MAG: hypothetical protein R3Y43_04280 [Alphaproteobacteria bacterium]
MSDENIQERLDQAVATAEETTEKFYNIVHGEDNETVTVDSGDVPTVAKTIKDIRESITTGVNDLVTIVTEAKETVIEAKNEIFNDEGFIAVAADLTGDNTIGTVASNIANVNITANIDDDISSVASIQSNVSTVANNISSVNTTSINIADVVEVSDNIANVNAVADNEANINNVSQNQSNINIVANNNANISTVADISNDVSSVANIQADVTTVANANESIALIVENIEDIQNASENALTTTASMNAAIQAKEAAAQSAAQAAASANLSDASESVKGVIQLASNTEALAGTNDAKAITPLKAKNIIDTNNTSLASVYATQTSLTTTNTNLSSHTSNVSNPHSVTKSQVGLGNCDNTSDVNKPISTATQTVLDTKQVINLPITTLATSGTIALSDNSINRISPTATVTFSLPSVTDHTYFHQILVQVTLSSTITLNLGTTVYFGGEAPEFEAGKYNIIYEHNGTNWVVGAVLVG